MARIAVTGALGGAGRKIAEHLRGTGHEVVAIDIRPSPNPFFMPSRSVDLSNYGDAVANLHGCDAVVHYGSNPWPDLDFFSGADRFANNTLATFNVFQAAAQLGIERVVWASSETVQGFPYEDCSPLRVPIDEADEPMPRCAYALSKLACELLAREMHKLHDITFIGHRLANILYPDSADGPGYDDLRAYWADPHLRRNTLWKYVDIRDVVSAVQHSLDVDIAGAHVFNIAAADIIMKTPTRELFEAEFPDTLIDDDLGAFQSPVALERARAMIGWAPRHSWRDLPQFS
ncbi:NAD-dependent epimerase/dehydratase family protein [Oricola sp.]|uniref:NAD-dependent epimerase/dehydratase family protein n=1 Tax=Oricola sp. TaxID=1979950 RepID=UPI003BAB16CC